MHWRSFLGNLALLTVSVIASTGVIFSAGEAFFRLHYGGLGQGLPTNDLYAFHQQRGWELRPGAYLYFNRQTQRVVEAFINELGLRNEEISLEVPAGKKRISVLGDSFVFAAGLTDGDKFTDKLQELAGDHYEIINVSVPGYGTGQEYRLLEELVSKGYDIGTTAILVFFTNDIQDNLGLTYSSLEIDPKKPQFNIDDQGNLRQTEPKPPNKTQNKRKLFKWSMFYDFLQFRLQMLITNNPALFRLLEVAGLTPDLPRTPGIIAGWYGPGWEERWSATEGILEYVVDQFLSQFEETELLITFAPSPLQVEVVFKDLIASQSFQDPRYKKFLRDMDRPQRMLRAFANKHGISFIDPTQALRAANGVYFPADGHFNEIGSEIVATVLHNSVLENN